MKKSLATVVASALLLVGGTPFAQNSKAPVSNTGATTAQFASSMNAGGQMGQIDEHMKKMQALHDKMMSATTADERQKIMAEQRKEMQTGMAMMNQMHGSAMMGGKSGGMMGQKGKPADPAVQMQMIQERMDMMQMMMQSMMDQQGMMGPPKAAK